ncbi:Monocarboxylate transporter 9 [Camelus dromedarius]|uniref:Monocarboxylate transporter 9 n=1 Tax=Camelus dromedarius TaxID=9838 RepID=A0A5N4DHZ3_CAMDR|nr:Monocarboxylate transporter 9 [Camelus dromedarius]
MGYGLKKLGSSVFMILTDKLGSSVGLFIYAALQRLLIEFYGLDGCLLIVGALALNILACGSLMRPLRSSDRPLPEKTALENVPDRYSVYNEKEKNLEENINILEKSYRGDETCKSTLANGDCKQESLLHKNPTTMAHTKETETYKKKVAERTYFCKQLAKRKWQLYKNYCEETVTLFKNKVFSALFIAIFLFDIGGFPPSLLMEDVARSSNVKEEDFTMPLISIIGIMTAVGKLILGILADFKWINTLYLYVATLIIMSLALCAIPFAKSYVTLAILSGIVGFLTGWFFDWTQTYDIAFYFSGFCVLLGGFILLLAALPSWDTCNKQVPKPAPTTFLYKVASNSSNV